MQKLKKKVERRARIRRGIRAKLEGTASRPRLTVFRSNSNIYAQLIDDLEGRTLAAASSIEAEAGKAANKTEQAAAIGKLIAERAKSANIESVVFDRNGYLYHGRVKALAEAAREGGLKF